jgi:hypothetical protein
MLRKMYEKLKPFRVLSQALLWCAKIVTENEEPNEYSAFLTELHYTPKRLTPLNNN